MGTRRIALPIQGMTCAGCVSRIERVLRIQPGVIWASVNFAAEEVTVFYDPALSGPLRLARAIRELGFKVPLQEGEWGPSRLRTSRLQRRTAASLWFAGAGLAAAATLMVVYVGMMALISARADIAGLVPVPGLPQMASFMSQHPISSVMIWIAINLAGLALILRCIDHMLATIRRQVN